MAKLTVTTFVTLDGIMQAPGGPQEDVAGGFEHGGWAVPHLDEDFGKFIDEVFARAGSFLLGRVTYQIFAGHWPHVTDPHDPVAARLNGLPKHVATRTLDRLEWKGSSIVRDVPAEVARLKRAAGGELQVHGSAGLLQTLLAHGLVDELNLLQFPVVLGKGKRLFGSGTVPSALRLVASRTTSKGVVVATYQPAGQVVVGTAELEDGATKLK